MIRHLFLVLGTPVNLEATAMAARSDQSQDVRGFCSCVSPDVASKAGTPLSAYQYT